MGDSLGCFGNFDTSHGRSGQGVFEWRDLGEVRIISKILYAMRISMHTSGFPALEDRKEIVCQILTLQSSE